jgi:Flp pilus assembly protein CpaB
VTLEVTPQQAELVNVSTELGKLSVTLRNPSTATPEGTTESVPVKALWAGDASHALYDAAPQPNPTAITPKSVTVIRGGKQGKTEVVKIDQE